MILFHASSYIFGPFLSQSVDENNFIQFKGTIFQKSGAVIKVVFWRFLGCIQILKIDSVREFLP
jgi:hypothetical protein